MIETGVTDYVERYVYCRKYCLNCVWKRIRCGLDSFIDAIFLQRMRNWILDRVKRHPLTIFNIY